VLHKEGFHVRTSPTLAHSVHTAGQFAEILLPSVLLSMCLAVRKERSAKGCRTAHSLVQQPAPGQTVPVGLKTLSNNEQLVKPGGSEPLLVGGRGDTPQELHTRYAAYGYCLKPGGG
jgi:hypothetical protein